MILILMIMIYVSAIQLKSNMFQHNNPIFVRDVVRL